jgi:tetratricopeptide (TPR) repeat protein
VNRFSLAPLDSRAPSSRVAFAFALYLVVGQPFVPDPPAMAQPPPANGFVTTRVDFNLVGLEAGVGASQRDDLIQVGKLAMEGKHAEADQLVDKVLAFFDQQMADASVDYVSVANRDQFNQYQKEHPGARKLVWLDWGYGCALLKKGFIASAQKRWPEAKPWLEKSVRMRPYSSEGYIELGYVLNKLGSFGDAVRSYETALELARASPMEKPFEPAALRGLSFALIELKELAKARKVLQDSLRVEPANRLARNELRYIREQERMRILERVGELFQQGRWSDLADKLDPVITGEPDNASARSLRAHALAELERWPQAVADLETAITLDDLDPSSWYFLAVALLGGGQDAEYRRACERMVQRFGIDYEASSTVIRASRLGPVAPKDTSKVLAIARARQHVQPKAADALADLGDMLYRTGHFGETVERLDEALKLREATDPANCSDLVFLAMAHQRLGHQDEARRFLSEARNAIKQAEASGRSPSSWYFRVGTNRLREEAEALINPKPARSKP